MLSPESYKLKIVLLLAVGFAFASFFGYCAHRIKASPILGYLLGGYLISPYSPGLTVDLETSEQLAEIGVVLMMFGVGLHFKWQDLLKVKNVAVPGAIIQTLATAVLTVIFIVYWMGWTWQAGWVMGLSIGVASTVVMVRILSDHHLLETLQGHIAVGWLIVEDVLTVVALLLLPILATSLTSGELGIAQIAQTFVVTLLKFGFLIAFMFTIGSRIVSYILLRVAKTHSAELLSLTVLALTFVIALSSTLLLGISIALGAFLAGMIIGETEVKHQAAAHALPLKDTFTVLFFLAVGMLFNPIAIYQNFTLFLGILTLILIIKPLVAFLLVLLLKHRYAVALTVAVALAQIGEFSFILSEEAMRLDILPDAGYDIIVACALVSIAINPLFFKVSAYFQK